MFGNANYKSCGCPRGCCDCGPSNPIRDSDLAKQIRDRTKELTFKCKRMDYVDARKRVIEPYRHCDRKHYSFISVLDRPTIKKAIALIEQIHEEFKSKKGYSPQMLKQNTDLILWAFPSYGKSYNRINAYFRTKFEYIVKETNWR